MIRLFCGFDEREAVGFHVFLSSVLSRTRETLSIVPLHDQGQDGSNNFTYARYRVAELCAYQGWAIFADACDMLMLDDVAKLWALRDERFAVQVVKHSYKTRNPIKYLGTVMQCPNVDYSRKNWSSLMLVNCSAPEWREHRKGLDAHQFKGFADERIGELPPEWNCLVDENQPHEDAKVLHWTAGIPGFPLYSGAVRAADWHAERELAMNNYG